MAGASLGAVASGALAIGAPSQAPVANATCLSVFGIGNGGDCTSTIGSIAVGIGPGTMAGATGLFGVAFAVDAGAAAHSVGVVFGASFAVGSGALAISSGVVDYALAVGNTANAAADGGLNEAVAVGTGAGAEATGAANTASAASNAKQSELVTGTSAAAASFGVGNYAIAVGKPGFSPFFGTTNYAISNATGMFNRAVVLGNGNAAQASPTSAPPLKFGNNTALVISNGSTALASVFAPSTNTVVAVFGKNKTVHKP